MKRNLSELVMSLVVTLALSAGNKDKNASRSLRKVQVNF